MSYFKNVLVDEESGLAVARVALVEATARLDEFVVEVVLHDGLGVAVHEPHEVAVVVLDAVLGVVLLPQEPASNKMAARATPHAD